MKIEQRKYARFPLPSQAFAVLGSESGRVGKVKDISLGGLAFEYMVGESIDADSFAVDIFMVGGVFHLYDLPCKLVYDLQIHVPHIHNTYMQKLTTNRCGIQFDRLSGDATMQLVLFLEAHSAEAYI